MYQGTKGHKQDKHARYKTNSRQFRKWKEKRSS